MEAGLGTQRGEGVEGVCPVSGWLVGGKLWDFFVGCHWSIVELVETGDEWCSSQYSVVVV